NPWDPIQTSNPKPNDPLQVKPESHHFTPYFQEPPLPPPKALFTSPFQSLHVSNNPPSNAAASSATPQLSATALLQKATTVGATATQIKNNNYYYSMATHLSPDFSGFTAADLATWQKNSDRFTRDFLGLTRDHQGGNGNVNLSMNPRDVLSYTGGVELQHFERGQPLLRPQGFGFPEPYAATSETWGDC
ncbi:hypothetical protein Gohar_012892, partial [Gossypium harknessii]|nr:hypothetical protein [Gossypium harknessii]